MVDLGPLGPLKLDATINFSFSNLLLLLLLLSWLLLFLGSCGD